MDQRYRHYILQNLLNKFCKKENREGLCKPVCLSSNSRTYGGRKNFTPQRVAVTSACMVWHKYSYTCIYISHTHTYNSNNNIKIRTAETMLAR